MKTQSSKPVVKTHGVKKRGETREDFIKIANLEEWMTSLRFFVNVEGWACVVYDRRIPVVFDWAEYDEAETKLHFITGDGEMIELGLEVPEEIQDMMKNTTYLTLLYQPENKPKDYLMMPLIIRPITIN